MREYYSSMRGLVIGLENDNNIRVQLLKKYITSEKRKINLLD